MSKNYDKSTLKAADGSLVKVSASDTNNVYLKVVSANETLDNLATHSGMTTLTVRPNGPAIRGRGTLIADTTIETPSGDVVEVRSYDSGKVTMTIHGEWGMTWNTLPRKSKKSESYVIYSFRKFV